MPECEVAASAPACALSVVGLQHTYPGRSTPALDGVSFSADRGELVFLLGPNGSGKSTLFRSAVGLLRPDAGHLYVNGCPLPALSARALARHVAYVPQQESLVFDFPVRDVVLMGRTPHLRRMGTRPSGADHEAADRALALLRIEHLAREGVRRLSGGERQLVTLARALAQDAPVLILDEPTSALDFANQVRVLGELRRLADRGYLVLVSSHQPQHALEYGDRALLLRRGRLLADSPVAQVDGADLTDLYGCGIDVHPVVAVPGLRIAVATGQGPERPSTAGATTPATTTPARLV